MPKTISRHALALLAAALAGILFLSVVLHVRHDPAATVRARIRKHQAIVAEQRACKSDMPKGFGTQIMPPFDDVAIFLAYGEFNKQAQTASYAPGYRLKDKMLTKTVSSALAEFFIARKNMQTYNVTACAKACDNARGCKAFNIYYQRSPTVAPSEGDDSRCPNPPSMTNIFCTLYSTAIKAKDVSWKGEMRGKFQTVITGSNIFNKESAETAHKSTGMPRVVLEYVMEGDETLDLKRTETSSRDHLPDDFQAHQASISPKSAHSATATASRIT